MESPSTEDRNQAPRNAPTIPGRPIAHTVRQWTLPKRQCAAPESRPVPSLAAWMMADAAAADAPPATSDRRADDPEPHPQGSVDQLGDHAGGEEDQQSFQLSTPPRLALDAPPQLS